MITNIPLTILNSHEKQLLFARLSADYLNMDAIYSDETENFVSPRDIKSGDDVIVSLRTAAGNVDNAVLHAGDKQILMVKKKTEGIFDYYFAEIKKISERVFYYFSITKNNREYFYNKKGLCDSLDQNYNFSAIPDFNVPEWVKSAVLYQIFTDRFYNGDKSNDVVNNEYGYLGRAAKKIENWHNNVSTDDICNFYGGDLKGIIQKMDYLKELGVEGIYLNPVFVSPSNHKYDIQDYDYIDPHYGVILEDGGNPLYFEKFHNRYATKYIERTTNIRNLEASNALMAELISIAHQNGIKVIIDGVFNHCGAFNKWMDKEGFYSGHGYPNGAYKDKNSPYHKYFNWYDDNWPNNDCYDAWWGHDNHPKLNYESSPDLYEYMLEIGKKWVSPPYNADGWRLDVAADLGYGAELNHRFWKDFRNAVKDANPNAVILAEHYGNPSEWLNGDQWDSVMNYDAFMNPITWFLTGMEKHSEEFRWDMLCNEINFENAMRYNMAKFSRESLYSAMNQLSNHDHSRFLTRTNMTAGRLGSKSTDDASNGINKGIMMEAVTFQMTWPGAPTLYYADEAGQTGWTDPDNRRTYPWGKEDHMLLDFHREIIKIHKSSTALKQGSVEYLLLEHGVISFGRWDGNEKIAVILNNNSEEKHLTIPVWRIGVSLNGNMESLICTDINGFSTVTQNYDVATGFLEIRLPGFSSVVLREK